MIVRWVIIIFYQLAHCFPKSPIIPWAVLNKLIGFFPSVTKYPYNPKPFNNLAFISGPAFEIAIIVSFPMALMIYLNFLISISANCSAFEISNSVKAFLCLISASFYLVYSSNSASLSIFIA